MAAILLAALLLFMLVPGQAEKTTRARADMSASPSLSNQTGGKTDQQPSPLIQCNVGLILPLLLAGLVTLGSRSKRSMKK